MAGGCIGNVMTSGRSSVCSVSMRAEFCFQSPQSMSHNLPVHSEEATGFHGLEPIDWT